MYRYILGAAGSGKTEYIDSVLTEKARKDPYGRYFLFVPEQNTLKAQQQLTAHSASGGILNLDVLSFQLLSYRVMEELGIKAPDILDDMSRAMLLRKAVMDVEGELEVYAGSSSLPGFISQLNSLITEFYEYRVNEEKLEEAALRSGGGLLSGKLSDIALIYRRFREYLTEGSTIPEEIPVILQKNIGRSHIFDGAEVMFDGFTGFTPVQLAIIGELFGKASKITFAFTIPEEAQPFRRESGPLAAGDMFWLVKENIYRLDRMAEKNGIRMEPPLMMSGRRGPEKMTVAAASDIRSEVRFVADSIRRQCVNTGSGKRFRDFAVAIPQPDIYRETVKTEFDAAGIPYFMDEKSSGFGTAVIELIRTAVSVPAGSWDGSRVTAYLRNPLCTLGSKGRELADRADNIIRARGLRGRKAFERLAAELPDIKELLSPLFRLHDALKKGAGNREKTDAVNAFLDELGYEERLSAYTGRLTERGEEKRALEETAFCGHALRLLDRIGRLFGNEKLKLSEYAGILDTGFSYLTAGSIPGTADAVIIGDLRRSRFDGISCLYIMGACEGMLPPAAGGGGIFTDAERDRVMELELELAPDDRQDASIQSYYLYLLMNKPSEHLYITRPCEDRSGKPMAPSPVLKTPWEYIDQKTGIDNMSVSEDVRTGSLGAALSSAAALAGSGHTDDRRFLELLSFLSGKEETADRLRLILDNAIRGYTPDRLTAGTVRALYGDRLNCSVSRIEKYESCPYSFFLRYGLGLSERKEFDIEAVDVGNLYHQTLDLIFGSLRTQGRDITETDEEELARLASECSRKAADGYNAGLMEASAKNRYIRDTLENISIRAALTVRSQLLAGMYRTALTEAEFERRTDRMKLKGRVDRLDICETDECSYLRVVDYKSGSTKIDHTLILGGLQLQLSAYMDEMLRRAGSDTSKNVRPGGMFYFNISDPFIDADGITDDENLENEKMKALAMNGFCLDEPGALKAADRILDTEEVTDGKSTVIDAFVKGGKLNSAAPVLTERQFEALLGFVRERINRDVNRIQSGDITVYPYETDKRDGCRYCPYKSICGFDDRKKGCRRRKLVRYGKGAFLKKLTGE